jgi:SOS-response transcriptional repressor LexA
VNVGFKSKESIHEDVGIVEEEGNIEAKDQIKRHIKYDARQYAESGSYESPVMSRQL